MLKRDLITMRNIFFYILISASLLSCGLTKSKQPPKENAKISDATEPVSGSFAQTPERLKAILNSITKINEVQYEHVGIAGIESDNYQNFLQLKKAATIDELVNLTNDTNNVVACYASWALTDTAYINLSDIFTHFLKEDKTVHTFTGCIKDVDNISSELYHRYWNSVEDKEKATDKLLLQLDSILLYSDNSYWLLMRRAFDNRIYPASYKSRIEHLAFKQGNREALFYLCNWYRADNYDNIKKSLITYLKNTDFSKTGTTDYYRTLDELLKFKDSTIETLIIQKLKKDKHWMNEEQRFKSLLDDYSIYENFD